MKDIDYDIRGLGVYMRDIAKRLRVSIPMTPREAATHAGGAIADEPYCTMVLLRLEKRQIARRKTLYIDDGFIRGAKWQDTALMYKWDADPDGNGDLGRQQPMPDITLKELFGEGNDK